MSDLKATPGPWGTDEHSGFPLDVHRAGTAVVVCRVNESKRGQANAYLIAQSPAMYEFIGRLVDDGLLDLGWHEEAEALMAKARGETS